MSTPFLNFSPGDLIKDTHVEQFIEPIQNLEKGKTWYAEATGSTNSFEVTLDPAPSAYAAGMMVNFKANESVTGSTTLNVNGLGAKSLLKEGTNQLIGGDITSGQMVSVLYDGTQFQMLSPPQTPVVQVSSPAKNVLVYAETRAEQPSSTITNLALPSFNFDSGKNYLLELTVTAGGNTAYIQVVLSDGVTDYTYPTNTGYVRPRAHYTDSPTYRKLLPTLSGSHSIEVRASFMGSAEVKLYEVEDNLVYADFSPSEVGSVIQTADLEDFTATSGRTYLLTMTSHTSQTAWTNAACYLTKTGQTEGIPYPDPTTNHIEGPYYSGELQVSKLLTNLDGLYEVKARRAYSSGVQVEIRDIT